MLDITKILKTWGEKERQVPEHNTALKSTMLAHVPELRSETPKRRMPWVSFAFAGMAMLIFLVQSSSNYSTISLGSSRESAVAPMSTGGFAGNQKSTYYLPPQQETPITDDREFLKTDYQAQIRTRQPDEKAQRIQLIVRGLGGRIDSISTSEKSGYISFALPENKFEAFRNEIQTLARDRFITTNISATNLLPQKQGIEAQQEAINTQLADLKAQRSALIGQHNRAVASLNAQIAASQDEAEKQALRARLSSENGSYSKKLASFDTQIKYAQQNLEETNKQDKQLLDNVATVQGTISLSWISVVDVINLYAGPYWLPIILAIAAIIAYFFNRAKTSRIVLPA